MNIRTRSPLRLGLAGGGTDVSPYCDTHGGCVLNATIDRYVYASLKTLDSPVVRFVSVDQQVVHEQSLDEPLCLDGVLNLQKCLYEIIKEFNDNKPIPLELSSYSDIPAGSGLGSSSTLVVSMIKGFVELLITLR